MNIMATTVASPYGLCEPRWPDRYGNPDTYWDEFHEVVDCEEEEEASEEVGEEEDEASEEEG